MTNADRFLARRTVIIAGTIAVVVIAAAVRVQWPRWLPPHANDRPVPVGRFSDNCRRALRWQRAPAEETRRDPLPYDIDFMGALGPPAPLSPPPEGVVRSQSEHDEAMRRHLSKQAQYARRFARRSVLRTADGWFVGFDAGESGGSLWWFPTAPGPGVRLSSLNVRAISASGDGRRYVAWLGFSHLDLHMSEVLTLEPADPGWRVAGREVCSGSPEDLDDVPTPAMLPIK